jgi:Leu/Phe-tRNA-protein transferase
MNIKSQAIIKDKRMLKAFMIKYKSKQYTLVDYQFLSKGIKTLGVAHLFRVDFSDVFNKELLRLID